MSIYNYTYPLTTESHDPSSTHSKPLNPTLYSRPLLTTAPHKLETPQKIKPRGKPIKESLMNTYPWKSSIQHPATKMPNPLLRVSIDVWIIRETY